MVYRSIGLRQGWPGVAQPIAEDQDPHRHKRGPAGCETWHGIGKVDRSCRSLGLCMLFKPNASPMVLVPCRSIEEIAIEYDREGLSPAPEGNRESNIDCLPLIPSKVISEYLMSSMGELRMGREPD